MRLTAIGTIVALAGAALLAGAAPAGSRVVSTIDLSQPFGTRQPWRFTATQGPDIPDPTGFPDDKAPGAIALCISANGGLSCQPDLTHLLGVTADDNIYSRPHFLNGARVVHARGGQALLLLQVASVSSANNDQSVVTVALAYDRPRDSFAPVYEKRTRRNNNQEIRFIAEGVLKGAIISAEPTDEAPFAFWITVNTIRQGRKYRQILRYRSATRYGDGNPLAVIDSEMPGIEQRLGLWKPGERLPAPDSKCLASRLVHQELWC